MAQSTFQTISDELLEYAEAALTAFRNRGHTVSREQTELGFPYTPAMLCKRGRTTTIVDVVTAISTTRVASWVAYAKSSGKDTLLVICLPDSTPRNNAVEDLLRNQGVGLYTASQNAVTEIIAPSDLALAVHLPPLESLPQKMRRVLGSAYDQFQRSNWREGFEDACQALENESRRYLKAGCRKGRIQISSKKGPIVPTNAKIDKMTLGQLARTFDDIQNQNQADSLIGKTLKKVNTDRVGVVHHKSKARTETRLRTNVGQHMWAIVNALRHLLGC